MERKSLRKRQRGPFRSNKGSCYEGGHRVPFILSWPNGEIGNGNAGNPGKVSDQLIGLQDLFATSILKVNLPDLGDKGPKTVST